MTEQEESSQVEGVMQLERPLVSFDLETTGLDPKKDRIVEIATIKLMPSGSHIQKVARLNPEQPIPSEATEVHGIRDEDVADAPTFRRIYKSLFSFLSDCDYTGYNIAKFDVPLLSAEFKRCGTAWPSGDAKIIDSLAIVRRMENRNLEWALRFYCGHDLDNAHSALPDARAALEVLLEQASRYEAQDVATIDNLQRDPDWADSEGKFRRVQGEVVINFGKHKDLPLSKLRSDYLDWIIGGTFPEDAKQIVSEELERRRMARR